MSARQSGEFEAIGNHGKLLNGSLAKKVRERIRKKNTIEARYWYLLSRVMAISVVALAKVMIGAVQSR